MKTNISISIDQKTLRAYKARARREKRSLSNVISIVLEAEISKPKKRKTK